MRKKMPGAMAFRAVWNIYKRNFFHLLSMTGIHVLLRVIALAPIILWFFNLRISLFGLSPLILSALISILLYLFIVYPARFYSANQLAYLASSDKSDYSSGKKSPYFPSVLAGFYRLFTGSLWGIPFFTAAYRAYQYVMVFPGKRFNEDFTAIGNWVSAASTAESKLLIGTIVFFSILVFSLLLFVYGWSRGVPFDFHFIRKGSVIKAGRTARHVRKKTKKYRRRALLLHFVLCLPACVIPIFIPYLQLKPLLTGYAMTDLQLIYTFVSAGVLSNSSVLLSSFLFLILYLPFVSLRKLHNGAIAVNYHAKSH